VLEKPVVEIRLSQILAGAWFMEILGVETLKRSLKVLYTRETERL
jgi:hypothetical protein